MFSYNPESVRMGEERFARLLNWKTSLNCSNS